MRIVIASYQGFDGAGVLHAHAFANELVRQGHEVLFLLCGEMSTAATLSAEPAYELKQVEYESNFLSNELLEKVRSFSPDIIHLWTPRNRPARVALHIAAITDANIVIHYEDDERFILKEIAGNQQFSTDDAALYDFFCDEEPDASSIRMWSSRIKWQNVRPDFLHPSRWPWLHPFISPVAQKLATGMTFISPNYQSSLENRFPSARKTTLYPGVDFEQFQPGPKPLDLLQKYGLENKTIFAYSGHLAPFHDLTDFVEVFASVLEHAEDAVLLLIGKNQIADQVDDLMRTLGIPGDKLVTTGRLNHKDMARHLALADVFIGHLKDTQFNRHRLPSKIPEYMAMGRPILLLEHGIGERLHESEGAFKVADSRATHLKEGIVRMFEVRPQWNLLGQKLRRRALQLFDLAANTRDLVEFYEEVRQSSEGRAGRTEASIARLGFFNDVFARDTNRKLSKTVVVLTEGIVGPHMSGIGIRYLEMAQQLAKGFNVFLGHIGRSDVAFPTLSCFTWSKEQSNVVLEFAQSADFVITHGFVLQRIPELRRFSKNLIIDIYCPFIFENLEIHADRKRSLNDRTNTHQADMGVLVRQLQQGDLFLTSSDRQSDFVLGMLTALGRIDPRTCDGGAMPEDFVRVVAMGVGDTRRDATTKAVMRGVWPGLHEDDFIMLWGGGIWSWLDPVTPIRAMAALREKHPRVKLVFLSTVNTENVIDMPQLQSALDQARELGVLDQNVIINTEFRVPYDEVPLYHSEANLGVCAHVRSLEAHYAYRTRLLDCIDAELPILASEGDALSDTVAQRGYGLALPIGDVEAWVQAIEMMVGDPAMLEDCRSALRRDRQLFTWSATIQPLVSAMNGPCLRLAMA